MREVVEESQCLGVLVVEKGMGKGGGLTLAMLIQAGRRRRGSSEPPER